MATADDEKQETLARADDQNPNILLPKFEVSLVQEGGDNDVAPPSFTPLVQMPDDSTFERNMYLFNEDDDQRPRVASLLSKITKYDDAIQQPPTDDAAPQSKANLGVLTGVYLPCIQNIFGVMIFIRMAWMTGTAGIPAFFAIVAICCSVTFCTSISLSAIATNGIVPAGGSYFMISRSLGPEFGGAVGILFFLGTSVAGAMYITGAVEILLNYIAPEFALYGDFREDSNVLYNNIRTYGTVFLIIIGFLVFIGVKFVSKFAPIALFCVLVSIISIYLGILINYNGRDDIKICVLNGHPLPEEAYDNCTKVGIRRSFCTANGTCDEIYENHEPELQLAIPGLSSDAFWLNLKPKFRNRLDLVSNDDGVEGKVNKIGVSENSFVFVDITTYFTMLIAIYFPSCTGILAGSNRSGDLQDAQKAIPLGTISAQLTTSFVYLSVVVLFGSAYNPLFIRDKFGQSLGGQLAATLIAWPHPYVILAGALLSTFGASLQSLVGAPRLLQAIAKDNIIPFLEPFERVNSRGEPVNAILVSLFIAECAVIIGNLDFIAPILTMFFLMCYMFLNLACTVQSLLHTPNWRPRFKYFHWSISLLGIMLCLLVMFLSSWFYALAAMALAASIYKYIEYCGAEKEWGDGIRGLALSAARFSLLKLEEGPPHTKNWRPQLLVLVKLNLNTFEVKNPKLLTFASQLKAGKGLTIVCSIIKGNYELDYDISSSAKQSLKQLMEKEKVKGFAEVIISNSIIDGLSYAIQTSGLGGLKHNTVIISWPQNWKNNSEKNFKLISLTSLIKSSKNALIIIKGSLNQWPDLNDKLGGFIDIWWIVHDGGLLILIGFILRQHKTWKGCKLRIYTVAQLEDNSIQMKINLEKFLYNLRIEAKVEIIEMSNSDISALTYERTVIMEQRTQILQTALTTMTAARPDEMNVRRMHTAVKLNEAITARSSNSKLCIINLPNPPKILMPGSENNYMEFIEVLTEGLERVLLVRGAGREVITIFS